MVVVVMVVVVVLNKLNPCWLSSKTGIISLQHFHCVWDWTEELGIRLRVTCLPPAVIVGSRSSRPDAEQCS
jgi:hypothetical protein